MRGNECLSLRNVVNSSCLGCLIGGSLSKLIKAHETLDYMVLNRLGRLVKKVVALVAFATALPTVLPSFGFLHGEVGLSQPLRFAQGKTNLYACSRVLPIANKSHFFPNCFLLFSFL